MSMISLVYHHANEWLSKVGIAKIIKGKKDKDVVNHGIGRAIYICTEIT